MKKIYIFLAILLMASCSDTTDKDATEIVVMQNFSNYTFRLSFYIKKQNHFGIEHQGNYKVDFEILDAYPKQIRESYDFKNVTNTGVIRLRPYGNMQDTDNYFDMLDVSAERKIKFTLYDNNKKLLSKTVSISSERIDKSSKGRPPHEQQLSKLYSKIKKLEFDTSDYIQKIEYVSNTETIITINLDKK